MPDVLYLNLLDQQYTRFIEIGENLVEYLVEKYGPNIDFRVTHENDRWWFYAPEELSKNALRHLVKMLIKREKDAYARKRDEGDQDVKEQNSEEEQPRSDVTAEPALSAQDEENAGEKVTEGDWLKEMLATPREWSSREESLVDPLIVSLGAKVNRWASEGREKEQGEQRPDTLQGQGTVRWGDHSDEVGSMSSLAEWLRQQGKYEKDEAIHRQTLQVRETVLGKDHQDTLGGMYNLAESLRQQGKYTEAEAIHRQTLQVRETVLGKDHQDTLGSMNNLAKSLRQQGKYTEAEAIHRQALQVRETVLGKDHPDTLETMSSLATTLHYLRNYIEAEQILRQVLQVRETVLGKDHQDTLGSMNNLAESLRLQRKYVEAETIHWQTLQRRETVLGKDHPDTLVSMSNLALLLRNTRRWKAAEDFEMRVIETRKRLHGADHPLTLTSMDYLASTYRNQGRLKESGDLQVQVIKARKRVLGGDHPDTLSTMANLAFTLRKEGLQAKAIALLDSCLQLRERVLGVHHPDTDFTRSVLDNWKKTGDTIQISETDNSDITTSDGSISLWSDRAGLTNPSSLSYETAADQEQVTGERSSMTFFNYKRPENESKLYERDDDVQSVMSIPDDIESLAESQSGIESHRQVAVNYIVSKFTSNSDLLALYQKATQSVDEAKFVRNHRRLLKKFVLDLHAEEHTPSQRLAVKFLRSRSKRTHISQDIHSLVMPSDSTVREKVNIMLQQDKDKLFLLNRLLNERDSVAQASATDSTEESDDDGNSSSDEYEPEIEESSVLSELEAATEFLTSGRPFRLYKENLFEFLHSSLEGRDLKERPQLGSKQMSSAMIENPLPDVGNADNICIEELSMNFTKPDGMTMPSLWLWLMSIYSPPLAGYQRISYTCGCGELTYLDVKELSPGGIERFWQRLVNDVSAVRNRAHDTPTSSYPASPAQVHLENTRAPRTSISQRLGRPTSSQGENVQTGSATSQIPSLNTAEDPQYVLLCVNTKSSTALAHVEVSSLNNDQYLFHHIYEEYHRIRREHEWRIGLIIPSLVYELPYKIFAWIPDLPPLPSWLSTLPMLCNPLIKTELHKIASGDFVQFQLIPIRETDCPTWFRKREFPPVAEVRAGRYLYEPVPMDDVEIIDIPLSHLLKPGPHTDRFWVTIFPKKLREPLARRPGPDGQRVIGWGIRINEDLNWGYILLLILIILVAISFSVVTFAAITSDNSSAFGLGAFLAALFTLYITYQYIAWKEALN